MDSTHFGPIILADIGADIGASAGIQSLRESTAVPAAPAFTWNGYFQAMGVLVLLLVALWVAFRLLRRFGGGRFLPAPSLPRQALRLEAQLSLGQHKSIVVVRFLNRRLALGVTNQQITLLTEMEASDDSQTTTFRDILEKNDSCQSVDDPPANSGSSR